MVKSAIVLMVGFDCFLHIYQLVKGEHFVTWGANYELFWAAYWSLAFVLVMWEFYFKQVWTRFRIKGFLK